MKELVYIDRYPLFWENDDILFCQDSPFAKYLKIKKDKLKKDFDNITKLFPLLGKSYKFENYSMIFTIIEGRVEKIKNVKYALIPILELIKPSIDFNSILEEK